jgi:hypothetical protein
MKSIVMPGNDQLAGKSDSNPENYQEPSEEKETLAVDAGNKKSSPGSAGITVVDMWNRERNRRLATDMIRRWNLN